MRYALAVLFLLHGIAHLIGFLVPWGFVESDQPPLTSLVNGTIAVSSATLRLLALLWIPLAAAFAGAAVGLLIGAGWWYSTAMVASAASLVFSVIHWPLARVGVYLNVLILLYLILTDVIAWLPRLAG